MRHGETVPQPLSPPTIESIGEGARKVYLLLGYRCNEKCLFCGVGEDKPIQWPLINERMYDAQQIKQHIENLVEAGLGERDVLEFSGGEPTIHRDVIDILSYARKNFTGRILLFSNGVRFASESFTRDYLSAGVDNTIITLHGSHAELHDRISGTPGSFKHTVAGLERLHDAGHDLSVKFIVNRLNYTDAEHWAEFTSKRLPRARLMINGLALWGQSVVNAEELSVRHSEVARHVESAVDRATRNGSNVGIYFMPACVFDPSYWQFFGYRYYKESVLEATSGAEEHRSISYSNCYNMPKACSGCVMQPRCTWAWKPYSDRYGLNELQPALLA
ncbi:radical SAM protein [Streptomyces hirsutus]|uniref:radical SAM protein n=1 Tax=Streptomyces hirsutus TaxID=35620 RepID=UPI0036B7625C